MIVIYFLFLFQIYKKESNKKFWLYLIKFVYRRQKLFLVLWHGTKIVKFSPFAGFCIDWSPHILWTNETGMPALEWKRGQIWPKAALKHKLVNCLFRFCLPDSITIVEAFLLRKSFSKSAKFYTILPFERVNGNPEMKGGVNPLSRQLEVKWKKISLKTFEKILQQEFETKFAPYLSSFFFSLIHSFLWYYRKICLNLLCF